MTEGESREDGETLVIEMTEGEKEVVSIEMATIKEIL